MASMTSTEVLDRVNEIYRNEECRAAALAAADTLIAILDDVSDFLAEAEELTHGAMIDGTDRWDILSAISSAQQRINDVPAYLRRKQD